MNLILKGIKPMIRLNQRNVPEQIVDKICQVVSVRSAKEMNNNNKRTAAKIDNLMVRTYLHKPETGYSACAKSIAAKIPEYQITNESIKERLLKMGIDDRNTRAERNEWALEFANLTYAAMEGDVQSLHRAKQALAKNHRGHFLLYAINSLFEYVPQLAERPERDLLLKLGNRYAYLCLKDILECITNEIGASSESAGADTDDAAVLKLQLEDARRELREYREFVEAADSEFDDKLEEIKSREFTDFFSALNNEKYGRLLDALYRNRKLCMEFKRSGGEIPYVLQGLPTFLSKLSMFFKDMGIVPATPFEVNSIREMTRAEMEGYSYDTESDEALPVAVDEKVRVKVYSPGWKYGDSVISLPDIKEFSDDGFGV